MSHAISVQPAQYLTFGTLFWFVGFYLHHAIPGVIPDGVTGHLYGTFALVGGIFIGVELDRLEFPTPDS